MKDPGGQLDALPGVQADPLAGGDDPGDPVHLHGGVRGGVVEGVDLHDQFAAAAVDDVLGLMPVGVQRRLLPEAGEHQLLRVGLAAAGVALGEGPVADGQQAQPARGEVAAAVVGDVPADAAFDQLLR